MLSGANFEKCSVPFCRLTHTRKNCVETVGEILLETTRMGTKNAQTVPDSTVWTYPSVLVRMRSPVRIWIAAPQNPRMTAVCGVFALPEKALEMVVDPHPDPHAEISGNGWILPGRKFQPFWLADPLSHDFVHKISHLFGGLFLFLPGGVGVGAEGEASVVVAL